MTYICLNTNYIILTLIFQMYLQVSIGCLFSDMSFFLWAHTVDGKVRSNVNALVHTTCNSLPQQVLRIRNKLRTFNVMYIDIFVQIMYICGTVLLSLYKKYRKYLFWKWLSVESGNYHTFWESILLNTHYNR